MNTHHSLRRCWAEIDLAALGHNVRAVRSRTGGSVGVMAVVKANAYGHGAVEAVRALADQVEMFGVANVAEALEVREHAPEKPVLILGPALPEERARIVEARFIPSVSSAAEARAYGDVGRGRKVAIHLKLDTGMGRIGIWEEEIIETAREILCVPGIEVTGVASHLPVADEDEEYTEEQLERFHRLADELQRLGIRHAMRHVANSAGAIAFPESAGDLVRAGLVLYGSSPIPEFQSQVRPVMTWKTRITLIREVGAGRGVSYGRTFVTPRAMRIATLAVGYADGYQRHLSNHGAEVLIGGKRCAVLGRVTMDQILADVSEVDAVTEGDEAVLIGSQGSETILAAELASKAGTIPWEIFTGVGRRVERVYKL